MSIPDKLVKKIALQRYLDSSRPMLANLATDWRPDVVAWNKLTSTQKAPYINSAKLWLEAWAEKYPSSVEYVVENWEDVDFSKT